MPHTLLFDLDMNKIEKIKAEIERLKKFNHRMVDIAINSNMRDFYDGEEDCCKQLLSFIDSLPAETSGVLVEEVQRYYSDNFYYITSDQPTLSILTNIARHFTNWQKEQMEKNRLAACERQTKEEYDREVAFVDEILGKENRRPTYSDAIEYGMRLQKEQMLKEAVERIGKICKQEEIDPAIARVIADHWWEML